MTRYLPEATAVLLLTVITPLGSVRASAQDLPSPGVPELPEDPYEYEDPRLPPHYVEANAGLSSVVAADNTPADNPLTNAGATLGRVLFYDRRLSANHTVACASCHQQKYGFSDPERFSVGYDGRRTRRRSMGLTNARYYANGRFFRDERAASLENLVLQKIEGEIEMGSDLEALEMELAATDFYPPLFTAAFGSPQVSAERISRALAQFVRSLVSFRSIYDEAFLQGRDAIPNFRWVYSESEKLGLRLFATIPGDSLISLRCDRCHTTAAQISDRARNNGLYESSGGDPGAGGGRFKAPSLRNVAVRGPYMHDGRFATLREVIEHYSEGVADHVDLDTALMNGTLPRSNGIRPPSDEVSARRNPYRFAVHSSRPLDDFGLRGADGTPQRLRLTETEIDALVAFLETLTDERFLTDPRFSDPFRD